MKKTISIVGGGSSALVLGCFLDSSKYDITIYEKNKALGRKFLVAGDGGFNLTHSEDINHLKTRYTPHAFLNHALENFNNIALREWLNKIGLKTFIGSSKRVYPEKGIKPITVLKTIEKELAKNKVSIKLNHEWNGWSHDSLLFTNSLKVKSDLIVFCLGGGSWSVTGCNSEWLKHFEHKEIETIPFQASNCEFIVKWKNDFLNNNAGSPLKNISVSCANKTQKGELVITKEGLEGNAIYALSDAIRNQLKKGTAHISIDLKPMLSTSEVHQKLRHSKKKNTSEKLRQDLKLSKAQVNLLKVTTSKEDFGNLNIISEKLKTVEIEIVGTAKLDNAISTIGGIPLSAVNQNFELKKLRDHFCIGEMLDWDAPTGGYLLQACFSSGVWLARYLNQ